MFPNITTALLIFVTFSASVASGEGTFSVLKRLKKYYRSTMGQDPLNGFATLNIDCDLVPKLDIQSIINAFSDKRARKAFVN
jgi:hypothetical protein